VAAARGALGVKAPGRALVTGANRGLGWWLSRALIARGWEVWGACRRPDDADELLALGPAGVVAYDASEGDRSADAVGVALGAAGIDTLDLLVNNAGVKPAELRPDLGVDGIHNLGVDLLTDVYRVNTFAPLALTRALLPMLRRATDGAVVANISSNLGSHERVVGPDIGYSSSKAALNMISHMLGRDLGPEGITVVAVTPGWVRTDMGGPNAPLAPEPTMESLAGALEALTPVRAGSFIDYAGVDVPW
jgi:NAD(P)-dependent dehydrogenase (short-subunit alcohol dehydrogenase family)